MKSDENYLSEPLTLYFSSSTVSETPCACSVNSYDRKEQIQNQRHLWKFDALTVSRLFQSSCLLSFRPLAYEF